MSKTSQIPCKFFAEGRCRDGNSCRFSHAGPAQNNQNAFSPLSGQQQDNRAPNPRGRGRGRGGAQEAFGNHQVRFDNQAGNPTRGGRGGGFNQGGGGRFDQPRGGYNESSAFTQQENANTGRGGRNQNNFNQGQQPPAGPRGRGRGGRGRGGFQGRNQNQQNNVVGPQDNYQISPQEILGDVTEGQDKPSWVCSCYAPGKTAPAQLIEGDELEVSPEELRLDFYMKAANGQHEEAANIERILSEEMSNRLNAIRNDPKSAMQYVLNSIEEHPNRFDVLESFNPKPSETRWSQFTREKQRRKQGVFADQVFPPYVENQNQNQIQNQNPNPNPNQNQIRGRGGNRGGFGRNQGGGFGQPQRGNDFSRNGSQQQQNAFGGMNQPQQTPGIFSRDNATPVNGSPFGRPSTPFGQQQPQVQDDVMLSPTHPAQQPSSGFGQNGLGGFFGNPQPTSTFGQPNFGQPQPQQDIFGNSQAFGQPAQQQSSFGVNAFAARSQPPQINGSNGVLGQSAPQAQPQPNGTPAPISKPPLEGPRAELKAAYDYMNQHGRFQNGVMPEMAPEEDWIA